MSVLTLDKALDHRDRDSSEGLMTFQQILKSAIEMGASDVHLQPDGDRMRVRIRIDGLLRDAARPITKDKEASVIAALINQSETLKIDEFRQPMDGRVIVQLGGKSYDLRVNVAPVQTGGNDSPSRRSAAIRILSKESVTGGLPGLGFTKEVEAKIHQITANPHGMLLLTGPTGSGKSTSLATILDGLNQPTKKIITVEDPVEYTISGVEQIEVNERRELTFASVLRSILRRDPDIIMVGEIRDTETARTAINASLTGHLVLSTLHTNDAPSATERLIDLGVEHYLLADILVGVLAQRLVRRICPNCKKERTLDGEELAKLTAVTQESAAVLYKGQGCAACDKTGYKGRVAIHELLVVDKNLISLISKRAPLLEVREAAAMAGMETMYHDGVRKALMGLTTIEEVLANARQD